MNISHNETGTKGSFHIDENGTRLATLTYSIAGPGRIIVDHTEVSPALRGKNAGKQLVDAAADFARKNSLKIIPLCPFTRALFEKTGKYEDVWDRD